MVHALHDQLCLSILMNDDGLGGGCLSLRSGASSYLRSISGWSTMNVIERAPARPGVTMRSQMPLAAIHLILERKSTQYQRHYASSLQALKEMAPTVN